MHSAGGLMTLWATSERPENSMQSCLALNRYAAEMAVIKSALMDLLVQEKHLLWLKN